MTKRALCVGINDYPGLDSDLQGCVNDAQDWAGTLAQRGYEVTALLDGQATKANMVFALQEIIAKSRLSDKIVFTYSGHGTWVPDRDGDEADRRDEALVCHDYDNGGLITDDELYGLSSQRRWGVQMTTVSDSCHSGTMARFSGVTQHAKGKPRYVSPTSFGFDPKLVANMESQPPVRALSRTNQILISGCADHEYSYDANFNGRFRGAMTAAALQALTHPNSTNWTKYFAEVRSILPSADYPQTPQLTATTYQRRQKPFA